MPLDPGTRLGPYEVATPLGAGGMGVVYRARDTRLGRDVAVKVLPDALAEDADRLARFEREARAVAALNHPNILVLFDVGRHDGTVYAVMELLEGETLRSRLDHGPLPVRRVLEFATQVAEGLAAAHARGIVHRDLKPENLFLTKDGRVKILDFGLARQAAASGEDADCSSPTRTQQTGPGIVVGTVGYMSPEQIRGEVVDHRSDMFSLGTILYEMLVGRRPFQAETAAETLTAILREEPPPLGASRAAVPAALEQIVRRCLEKNRDERLHSAHDLALYLRALAEPSTVASGQAATPTSRRRSASLAPAVFGLLLALAAFAAGRRTAPPPAPQPTFRQLTFRRGTLLDARFTPDGQGFLYGASWDVPGRFALYLGRLDSAESRSVEAGQMSRLLAVSSAGEVAFLRGNDTLARMPIAGGAPRDVLDHVTWADWSPDGRELAVARARGDRVQLEFPIGTVLADAAQTLSLRVAPTGDAVAVLDQEGPTRSISVVGRDRKKTVLSRGWGDAFGMAWSPDGSEVWFTAARSGHLRTLNAVTRGGRERVVLSGPTRLRLDDVTRDGRALLACDSVWLGIVARRVHDDAPREMSWLGTSVLAGLSDDGRFLLFYEYGDPRREPVYLRATDGSPAVRLGEGRALALSPDAAWALVDQGRRGELSVVPTGAGEPRTLNVGTLTSIGAAGFFGQGLFFEASEPGHGTRTYVSDLQGAWRRPVTPEGVVAQAVSPDGRWLAASDRRVYPVEGGAPRDLPSGGDWRRIIRWAADGRSIYVERNRSNSQVEVLRLELTTGRLTPATEWVLSDPAGSAGISQGMLSADARTSAFSYSRFLTDLYVVEGLK